MHQQTNENESAGQPDTVNLTIIGFEGIPNTLGETLSTPIEVGFEGIKITHGIYCICKEPYDETHSYVGCDMCEDWFHCRCVGVLPVEGNEIPEYKCPQCCPKSAFNTQNFRKLVHKDYEELKRLMQEILELEEADEFYYEVDPHLHPNYTKVIREPMELKTMEQRVREQVYVRLSDFVAGACRIFDNCKHNLVSSSMSKCAIRIEHFLVSKLTILRESMITEGSG